jgi:pyrimidine-nucleoside phosphorylase
MDVKWGKGAFMKTLDDARALARSLVEVGRRMDKGMCALVTDMNQPLGHAVGNAVEVLEAVATLQGRGPGDLLEVTLELGVQMLLLADQALAPADARHRLEKQIQSGAAFETFKRMVELHGGDPGALDPPKGLPSAELHLDYPAPESGYLAGVDAEQIGKACIVLGAGRRKVTDAVDHGVGMTGLMKIGKHVEVNQPLLTMHANQWVRLEEAGSLLHSAFRFSPDPPSPGPLIAETL